MRIIIWILSALLLGVMIALWYGNSNPLYYFAWWRTGGISRWSALEIAFNNIIVIAMMLYGGVLGAMLEIKSWEKMSPKLYLALDKICYPLHFIFSIFDSKLKNLKHPFKSCYFITVSFAPAVLFINLLIFGSLITQLLYTYGINTRTVAYLSHQTLPLALIEFGCMGVATIISLKFPYQNYKIFENGELQALRCELKSYLTSPRNFFLMLGISIILSISAWWEHSMLY